MEENDGNMPIVDLSNVSGARSNSNNNRSRSRSGIRSTNRSSVLLPGEALGSGGDNKSDFSGNGVINLDVGN